VADDQLPPELNDGLIGTVIADRYKIVSPLGKGGMGLLYLAQHMTLKKDFVVKVIRSDGLAMPSEIYLRRFRREAKAVALVNHPHVVKVVDFDVLDGTLPYIIMEFVEGIPLKEFMSSHPGGLPIEHVSAFMKQLCSAVAAIHRAGIVHRDLKPSNVMVQDMEGEYSLTIIDFGLVHTDDTDSEETGKIKLTKTGQILGSPYYMSPEQCRGADVDERADIYALGLIAYELITGMQAVDGKGFLDIVRRQISEPPEPISEIRSGVPVAMIEAVGRALQKQPDDRFDTPQAFYEGLSQRFLDRSGTMPIYRPSKKKQEPAQEPKSQRAIAIGVIIAVLVIIAVYLIV